METILINVRVGFVLALLALISGCAGFVKSDVAIFHKPPLELHPTKYTFLPTKGQASDLEYKTYQDLIRKQLAKYGYKEISTGERPKAVIIFSYGIDSGREKLSSLPIIGQTGVSSSQTYGTLNTYGNYGTYSGNTNYTPTYGVVGTTTVSKMEYTRGLRLYIVNAQSLSTKKLDILYEGSVKSAGSSSQLSRVMPAMIKALFKKFPGKSGETRSETIPVK
ncbi:MAG: DUF4136 domain-containing protein [Nitrospiraceae bacterium]|nr:DUF4136 domain-containing protein [Nitrospiraceae bacterium]